MRSLRALLGLALMGCAVGSQVPGEPDAAGEAAVNLPLLDASNLDSGSCTAPDVLVVLDRSQSMEICPDGKSPPNTMAGRASSKWGVAVSAIHGLGKLGTSIRAGLEIFPQDPTRGSLTVDAGKLDGGKVFDGGGGVEGSIACAMLPDLLSGTTLNAATCLPGEVLVPPDVSSTNDVVTAITTDTTPLCLSTPIGAAMTLAGTTLLPLAVEGRKQYTILITDGGETCGGSPVAVTQDLAQKGIHSFIVGFGIETVNRSGVLNDLACAGMTAKGFPATCTKTSEGYVAADPKGTPLYYDAADGPALETGLAEIASRVCCGCQPK